MSLRIIGGELKGKKLYSTRGAGVRPTADRLRESIFNILLPYISGAIVLDLFAGTGAYGIEAMSRGAVSAVFIDNNRAALSVISSNIAACAYDKRTKVIKWDIKKNLQCLKSNPFNRFTLIFIDPPYNRGLVDQTLHHLGNCNSVSKEAIVVVEHSSQESIAKDNSEFIIKDQRKYRKTLVSFLTYGI